MCQEFKKTRFITVPITQTLDKGIAIGQGACKAVRLRLNAFQRNSINTPTAGEQFFIYYGDSQTQENELLAIFLGQRAGYDWSPLIYCENLEEVHIRYAGVFATEDWPAVAYVQVMIYE